MIKNFFTLTAVVMSASVFAQANYWSKTSNVAGKQITERTSQPKHFKLYNLNLDKLSNALQAAPQRFSDSQSLVLKFPDVNGNFVDYVIEEASVLSPELQAKYSSIRSYVGYQKSNKSNTIRFSVTPTDGINVMYFNEGRVAYMDTYTSDKQTYVVYDKKDLAPSLEKFNCGFEDESSDLINKQVDNKSPLVRDGKFRTYRLALACTTQYANFHVNRAGLQSGTVEQKKQAVLAAMAASMTRVNGVYEKTLALTMVMIPNNDKVIFLTAADYPASGGYTNNDGSAMLSQNQTIVDNIIGASNYDIGHVFSTGGGGIARLNSPCNSGLKARGVTGSSVPTNDAFNIDYVAHEMGHQFGAQHTFNNNTEGSCLGNRSLGTAYEPGGGSTIMAYAGICGPMNLQPKSDAYFHSASVDQMYAYISRSADCAVKTGLTNQPPVIDPLNNYIIPKGTPFVLTGNAVDPDGDQVTYLWEQLNAQHSVQPPDATSTVGPTFRSYFPTVESSRYFPKLSDVVNGVKDVWEVLPTVARSLSFSLFVNDGKASGAQSARSTMEVTLEEAGPFQVTSHTSYVQYGSDVPTTVTWDVAGTNVEPIDTQAVQIVLSKDNGLTFDTVLADNVPNNGSAQVMLPSEDISLARIMIKAKNNIYYAVNSSAFGVKKTLGVSDIAKKGFTIYPNPAKTEVSISVDSKSSNVTYAIYDLSGRMIKGDKVTASGKVSVAELATGTYRMVVTNNGEVTSQNLVIKK